jgi:hypothetical protein
MRAVICIGLFAAAVAIGCSSNDATCSGGGGNLTVSVDDPGNNDMLICDATVTVTPAGGMPQTLAPSGPVTACVYKAQLPQGSYVVEASKPMYRTQSINLKITMIDGCHVDSPSVTLSLIRTP